MINFHVLHSNCDVHILPIIDCRLEARAIDDRLGDRQAIDLNNNRSEIAILFQLFVHLLGHVNGVIPLGAVGKNGINSEQVGIGSTVGAMAESMELSLQRGAIDGIDGECLRG